MRISRIDFKNVSILHTAEIAYRHLRQFGIQGVPKKRKLLKSLIVKIECPTKKLNVICVKY